MDLGLDGARALVGGGSSGLGGAIAHGAGRRGRTRRAGRPAFRPARRRRRARSPGSSPSAADLATPDGPASAVEQAVEAPSAASTCCSSTPVARRPGTFDELDEAGWQRAIDGTLHSALRLIRAALPHLRDERSAGHPRHPVVVGARADPRPDRLEHAAPGPGRPHQVADRGDRPDPHQRPRAGPRSRPPDHRGRRG